MSGPAQAEAAPTTLGARAIALLVAGTFFMENLDATAIAPAVPHMAADFGVEPIALNAGISAYMLTLGIFIPISGWVADRFGPRRVFACAIALFTLASLLCGTAQSLPQFIAMRVLQGIGGAMMVPVGRLVVLRVTPRERLIVTIAMLTWPALVAPVLGPPIGGLITEAASWRWIFYLNLPLGVLAFITALLVVPRAGGDKEKRFDWPGFVFTGGALFSLLFAAELFGHTPILWTPAIALIAIGTALLVASAWHLNRTAHPMIDLAPLKLPTFGVAIWGGSAFRMGVGAIPFLLPLMCQIGFGYNAFEAGALLMAVFVGNIVIKPATTPILRRFGFRPVLIVNGVLNALFICACALMSPSIPLTVMAVVLCLGGMSRSIQFTALNTIAFSDVPREKMSGANTLFSAAFQLALGLGVALGAICWRVGDTLSDAGGDPALPFRVAFVLVGLVSLLGVADALRLKPDAGAHVSKAQAPKVRDKRAA
ncbi:MFS transporter [Azorhizobium oxalatiphilum]|uniref:MFS transporter n=1 Tax=Azorhizobium oxalatiphilum TaxID=980631 RepID=A0A917FDL5_9HYPH|nr:MFS transporter [Azorhizobium oxalatiphilum]GGF69139.1 MFS transporter [Azorhizobium oxalatiphilum]